MIYLEKKEAEFILEKFSSFETQKRSHTEVWKKRQYAPMYIDCDKLKRLKYDIMKKYPDYTIAFDVIFESQGNFINWHTDHESLGPFLNDSPYRAIKEGHFMSIHFNLTRNGGSLTTLEWPILSYINHQINIKTNIFSIYHKLYSYIVRPFSHLFAYNFTNEQYVGNIFNNIALHCVTKGEPRISYVLRLIKTSSVLTSKQCILEASKRSYDCKIFEKFSEKLSDDNIVIASKLFSD